MTRCDHDAATHDYQSFNELDGTLSIHTVCDACCETLEVRGFAQGGLIESGGPPTPFIPSPCEYIITRDGATYPTGKPERRA